jgi:deoxyadenosine/deoxycytidine kinase
MPLDYLKQLQGLYEDWFEGWGLSPILEVDTEKIDYISDFVHRREFQRAVEPFIS